MKICVLNITPVPAEYVQGNIDRLQRCCAKVLSPDTELHFRGPEGGCITLPQ